MNEFDFCHELIFIKLQRKFELIGDRTAVFIFDLEFMHRKNQKEEDHNDQLFESFVCCKKK